MAAEARLAVWREALGPQPRLLPPLGHVPRRAVVEVDGARHTRLIAHANSAISRPHPSAASQPHLGRIPSAASRASTTHMTALEAVLRSSFDERRYSIPALPKSPRSRKRYCLGRTRAGRVLHRARAGGGVVEPPPVKVAPAAAAWRSDRLQRQAGDGARLQREGSGKVCETARRRGCSEVGCGASTCKGACTEERQYGQRGRCPGWREVAK